MFQRLGYIAHRRNTPEVLKEIYDPGVGKDNIYNVSNLITESA